MDEEGERETLSEYLIFLIHELAIISDYDTTIRATNGLGGIIQLPFFFLSQQLCHGTTRVGRVPVCIYTYP